MTDVQSNQTQNFPEIDVVIYYVSDLSYFAKVCEKKVVSVEASQVPLLTKVTYSNC